MSKSVSIKITCDTCSKDLSPKETNCPHDFILKVSVQDVAIGTGVTYGLMMHPPIDNDLYFCGLGCMTGYKIKKDDK